MSQNTTTITVPSPRFSGSSADFELPVRIHCAAHALKIHGLNDPVDKKQLPGEFDMLHG
jgi:hypothetical protein